MNDGILQVARLFGKQTLSEKQARIAEALKQHPLMTDEQLLKFEKAVLEIAAHERGNRKKAQEFLVRIVAEKIERGI